MLETAYIRIVPPLNMRGVSPSLNEDKLILYQDDSFRLQDEEHDNSVAYAIGSEKAIMHCHQYEEQL